jgi:hypothetical protein
MLDFLYLKIGLIFWGAFYTPENVVVPNVAGVIYVHVFSGSLSY